ncbi:uncharacterized protein LOC113758052 [Coffea eugenioides]|uniref:uncharacterized protein LOC113758052 n=1 Tax=Coffea eugenioides TaxID=49369 RepID=UPI000F6103C3|nr:uncharacterized protein LOC113758052 [Coffea eugenioides]
MTRGATSRGAFSRGTSSGRGQSRNVPQGSQVSTPGHKISKNEISVDLTKVDAVTQWKQPETPMEIRSFLGLTGYYCRFIKDFSRIVGLLTNLTKKHGKFMWNPKCEVSFQELKKRLTMAPILTLPNEKERFMVYLDASKEGLSYVLM